MANLLITGGAGFIGVNFVRYWRQTHPGDTLVVYDALTYAGNKASLAGVDGITFIKADICDAAAVDQAMTDHAVDTIVHFAAESHVDRSITGPDAFITTNVVGTHTLLKAAKTHWLDKDKPHRFHHVSTDEVYGSLSPEDPAFSETTPYAPNSPYSASKASSDHLVRAYHHTYGLETTISNCSNNYGPYQFPEKLMPLFLLNALNGRDLPIYGDGMNVRDWLYVEDHCYGIDLILQGGKPGEVYNIGGGAELTNLAVIDHLCAAVDAVFKEQPDLAQRFPNAPAAKRRPTSTLKTFVTDRAGHDRRYAIDCRKIESALGYKAQRSFEQGFRDLVTWYLANESWWTPLLK
jgi:dTDP-glucose 4,6-dehydratase